MLRLVHDPDRRSWDVEEVVPFYREMKVRAATSSFVEWLAFFFGSYEAEVAEVLRSSLSVDGQAIDVGANVGFHTLVMSKAAPQGRVVACEPNPLVRDRLMQNLEMNGVKNVVVDSVAISDAPGRVTLFVPEPMTQSNQSTASLQRNVEFLTDAREVIVNAVTLDELVERHSLDRLELIKIDVEGFEGAVLEGAKNSLSEFLPTLVFEYKKEFWEQSGFTFEQVVEYLREKGYREIKEISRRGLLDLTESPRDYSNMLVRSPTRA